MSGMKPLSSMRSAFVDDENSPTTHQQQLAAFETGPSGGQAVANQQRSTPPCSQGFLFLELTPPMSRAHGELQVLARNFSKFSATLARVRAVGQRIRQRGMRARAPSARKAVDHRQQRKAAVLPVPVWAMPVTSPPARMWGMASI